MYLGILRMTVVNASGHRFSSMMPFGMPTPVQMEFSDDYSEYGGGYGGAGNNVFYNAGNGGGYNARKSMSRRSDLFKAVEHPDDDGEASMTTTGDKRQLM